MFQIPRFLKQAFEPWNHTVSRERHPMHFKDKVFLSEALNHLFTAINYWNCYWAVPEMKQSSDLHSVSSKCEFRPTRLTKNHLHPLHSPSSSGNSAKRTLQQAGNWYRDSGEKRISGNFTWPLSSRSTTPNLGPWLPEFRGAVRGAAGLPDPSAVFSIRHLKKASTGSFSLTSWVFPSVTQIDLTCYHLYFWCINIKP